MPRRGPGPKRKRKTKPSVLFIKERRAQALALRVSGANFREIAATMREDKEKRYPRYSEGAAYADVIAECQRLNQTCSEEAELIVAQEEQRLDAMLAGIYPKALFGNTEAINAVIRLMERRARYRGLDRPTKLDLGGQVAIAMQDEITKLLRYLKEHLEEGEYLHVCDAIKGLAPSGPE